MYTKIQLLPICLYLPCSVTVLSAVDVSFVSHMKHKSTQDSSLVYSNIVCWVFWHNDLEIAIFLKNISHKNGFFWVISLSRSNRVGFIFGSAGIKVAILEMCRRIAISLGLFSRWTSYTRVNFRTPLALRYYRIQSKWITHWEFTHQRKQMILFIVDV